MRLSTSLFFLLAVLQATEAKKQAAPTPPPSIDKPTLSGAGKKRLLDNLNIVEENIRTTQLNLQNSTKNIETIQSEIKTLNDFVTEHAELRKKYNAYLANAYEQIKKNEAAGREIAEWATEKAKTTKVPMTPEELKQIERDKADRLTWRKDADSKVARVHVLLRGLDQNLNDIETRRTTLKAELDDWNTRRKQFDEVLASLNQRKAEMQKLARRAGMPGSEN